VKTALFALLSVGISLAQSNLAATAVPDQNNGKDYAGRPIENPTVPQASIPRPAQEQTVEQNVQDIHFAFDRYDITPEQQAVLQADAQWLRRIPIASLRSKAMPMSAEESHTTSRSQIGAR